MKSEFVITNLMHKVFLVVSANAPPPSSYCSSPPIKDKVPFHQPIPFIMTSPTLYLLFIGNINPPFYHAPLSLQLGTGV